MDTPTIFKLLDMSTGHLQEETTERMDEGAQFPFIYSRKVVGGEYYGYFVHVPDAFDVDFDDGEWPEDMIDCMKFAMRAGVDWIMFDAEGKVYDDLKKYEW